LSLPSAVYNDIEQAFIDIDIERKLILLIKLCCCSCKHCASNSAAISFESRDEGAADEEEEN
jgi:hypothetical protein